MAADCERMLDTLHAAERRPLRELVGDALLATRHMLAILAAANRSGSLEEPDALEGLAAELEEPRQRIADAMGRLLRTADASPEHELLLQDARAVRDSAVELAVTASTQAADGTAATASRAAEGGVRSPLVLIADDDRVLRAVLERLLRGMGLEVVAAEHGGQAAELLERQAFDLVLTDINMPKVDGISLLGILKASPRTRDVPVIVVSSQDDEGSIAKCIELGAADHIAKPFDQPVLQARVRASLERKRMRDVELDYLGRVTELTKAAEAVERDSYEAGMLAPLCARQDDLGQLARVFDRMVSALTTRQARLQERLQQLRGEVVAAHGTLGSAEVPPESAFVTGEVLAGRYEILGHLGKGGMGTVYHARDMELGEEVALKVVRRDLVQGDPTVIDRLKSEIRLTRRISHRNVVRAHDLGEYRRTYFITMELVKGITLAELLDRRGRLTVQSTLAIATQLADALCVAHEQQIIHRDIKPANLLIDESGCLKVMDFGLARLVECDMQLTQGGFIIGTPQYMSPEQLMGGGADARSDLFAVGVVLYECLAGRPPYAAESPLALAAMILDGDRPSLDKLVPDVPAPLVALLHQLIEAQPEKRPASAVELRDRLTQLEHMAGA